MAELPGIKLSAHYLDDGTFGGKIEDLVKVVDIVLAEGPDIGAFLNLSKSFVWWPSPLRPDWTAFPPELQRNNEQGFKILGAAIGSAEFKRDLLDGKIVKQEKTLDKIASIRRAHHQFILIKYCANSYKLAHYLRTVDPALYPAQLKVFDEMMSVALADTFGFEISPTDRLWFSLPVKQGGLGLPTTCNIAGASYLASCIQSGLLQAKILGKDDDFNSENNYRHLQHLNTNHQLASPITMEQLSATTKPQAFLCDQIFDKLSEELYPRLTPRQQILFKASKDKSYVPWLGILPTESFGQCIPHLQFQIAAQFTFGKRISNKNKCQGCGENQAMDPFAEHATICKYGGGETSRHNAVRDMLAQIARHAKRVAKTEEKNLLNDGTARKPADVSIESWTLNRKIAIDVAVISGTSHEGIKKKEAEKRTKYLLKCSEENLEFKPFVLDSFGRMGDEAIIILRRLSYNYADACQIAVCKAKHLLKAKIMLAMVKEQSRGIMNRIT